MRLWRDQGGELSVGHMLVAMSLMLGVLGATLTVFSSAERLNRDTNVRTEMQDQARTALDALTAQLRNLASPTYDQPQAIDRATPYDVVFQTVDRIGPNSGLNAANVMRVRYCLGTTDTTTVYRQQQRWTTQLTPAAPSSTVCPAPGSATGWSITSVAASAVVNRADGQQRPLFTYNAVAAIDISSVRAQLFVDSDTARAPAETTLSSGVFLRNQNRRPVAVFTVDSTVRGRIILNGASSADPEGDPLEYVWFDGDVKIGDGIRLDHTVTPGSTRAIQLKVFDLAGLQGDSAVQSVVVPS